MDNLSAPTGPTIRRWAARHAIELYFTPTYASRANPVEVHVGPLRRCMIAGSTHPTTWSSPVSCTSTCAGAMPTPATRTYWPPSAGNVLGFAANATGAGVSPGSKPRDHPSSAQPGEPSWSGHYAPEHEIEDQQVEEDCAVLVWETSYGRGWVLYFIEPNGNGVEDHVIGGDLMDVDFYVREAERWLRLRFAPDEDDDEEVMP